MPGVNCSYGNAVRLDLPVPFFLRQDPFLPPKPGKDPMDWNWNTSTTKELTLIVKKRERQNHKQLPSSSSKEASGSGHDGVGGCPLECPFDPNEDFDDTQNIVNPEQIFAGLDFPMDLYESFDVESARALLKKIKETDKATMENLGLRRPGGKQGAMNPIYMACSARTTADVDDDLVMRGFDDDKFLELRMFGPYKSPIVLDMLDIDYFESCHNHLPAFNDEPITKQAHAIYEKVHGNFPALGKVFLEFIWKDPKVMFEYPPVASARCKLAIKPKPGDANPFLRQFWEEIEALDKLIGIRESNHQRDLNKNCHNMTLEVPSNSSVLDDMKALMKLPSIPIWNKDTEFSNSVETVLERVLKADRSDVDFTDKAWTILKNSNSVVEVYDCFKLLLESIENKEYRPYLFPSNETIFSVLLKDLLSGKTTNFRTVFSPTMALDITIDCGIHKLFRDYSFVLKMCNLAQLTDLYCFSPKAHAFRKSVNNIKKLHCVFEVLCLSKERLALNMTEQETHAQMMLEYFELNQIDWNHTFHFNVPMAVVETILNGMTPIYWNLKLESSTALRQTLTNAIISRDFFIPHATRNFITSERVLPRGFYVYVHRLGQRRES